MGLARLINEKNLIESKLKDMVFGSIEVRETGGKKFIYVHYREGNNHKNKYVGEYSLDLYNLIVNNNIFSKAYKKRLREIYKELYKHGYSYDVISEEVLANIATIKEKLPEMIYNQVKSEGLDVSITDVKKLISSDTINNMNGETALKIINLKRAWDFILLEDTLRCPSNLDLLKELNYIIGECLSPLAGSFRTVSINDKETNIPEEKQVEKDIDNIVNGAAASEEKTNELYQYIKKNQLFLTGNELTAIMFANHMLLKDGKSHLQTIF